MNATNILVVEDSKTQAERLKYFLEQNQYVVALASNGQEALQTINNVHPSLLISDIIMPEMDGYELCKRLRLQPQFKNLPIILLTTLSDAEDIIRGLECCANYFITKPYEEEYLLKRIQDILNIQKIRQSEKESNQVKIVFRGKEHVIAAEKTQILDLLVSTYDAAVQKNQQLNIARMQLQELNAILEKKVEERTAALRVEKEHFRALSEKLKASLEEKEAMLKEIYHRVKNNLQVILSLLSLQVSIIQDSTIQAALNESASRVKSMALIHEMLYQSQNLAKINMSEYIHNLLNHLYNTYNIDQKRIEPTLWIDDISLDIDIAIPCGLMLNELISNIFKHAFPLNRSGKIMISLHQNDERMILTVIDNGVGMPKEIDLKNSKTLGLQLIYNLSKQLNGDIQLDRNQGTTFIVHFRV